MIDIMKINLLMSVIYARTLYTDSLTSLTLSFSQKVRKNVCCNVLYFIPIFAKSLNVNHVIMSRVVLCLFSPNLLTLRKKSLNVNDVSNGDAS